MLLDISFVIRSALKYSKKGLQSKDVGVDYHQLTAAMSELLDELGVELSNRLHQIQQTLQEVVMEATSGLLVAMMFVMILSLGIVGLLSSVAESAVQGRLSAGRRMHTN